MVSRYDWDIIKQDPEKLIRLVNDYSARSLADKLDINKNTVNYWLEKYGFTYNHSTKKWEGDQYSSFENSDESETKKEGKLAGVKEGQDERGPEKEDLGDYWLITSGKKEPFKISKEKYEKIRRDYCDELGSNYLTISEITRKYNITRSQFKILKNAFGFVHNDVRYTDEEIQSMDMDDLVDKTLEEQKNQYIKKLQQKKYKSLEKEVNKYRKKDFFVNKIHDSIVDSFENTSLKEFKEKYGSEIPREVEFSSDLTTRMLEFPLVDFHFAKLAWEGETGENFDLQIARELFHQLVDTVIWRAKIFNIEKVVFPIGNDFFHFDDSEGNTTRGTSQDTDTRWQKMFSEGMKLFIAGINKLQKITDEVEVFLIPGNHDWMTSYYAIEYLSAWYKDSDKVKVNTDPKSRKYVKYGNNLIGFTHGSEEKKRIYGCMQAEVPEYWADTTYREWHGGHLHSEQVKEDLGVVVRNLPSPTSTDAWHYRKAYISYKRLQVFAWHKKYGLDIIVITLPIPSNS